MQTDPLPLVIFRFSGIESFMSEMIAPAAAPATEPLGERVGEEAQGSQRLMFALTLDV